MKLPVVLAVLIGPLVLACSSAAPAPAEPTPNIDATVEARVAQERAVDATVEARAKELVAAQVTPTAYPTNTQAAVPTYTPHPTYTPKPVPTNTPTLVPTATSVPTPTPTPTGPKEGQLTPDGQLIYRNGVWQFLVPTPTPTPTAGAVFVSKWGTYGTGDGEFISPSGVAVGPDGSVYVADNGTLHTDPRIQKFTSEGVFVSKWGKEGPDYGDLWKGSGDGEFWIPYDVAVASDGSVYVADRENRRIQKFKPTR